MSPAGLLPRGSQRSLQGEVAASATGSGRSLTPLRAIRAEVRALRFSPGIINDSL